MTEESIKEEDLKLKLTSEQYKVMRKKRTETPFTGKYVHKGEDGTYMCIACGNPLFNSDAQFDSGTGWLDPTNQIHSYRVVSNFCEITRHDEEVVISALR